MNYGDITAFDDDLNDDSINGRATWSCTDGVTSSATAAINSPNTDSLSGNDQRRVMMHEVGHALGLDHTSPECAGVMWTPSVNCTMTAPTQDDVNGIEAIY